MPRKYGEGIYKILRVNGGWCVARLTDSAKEWHRISNLYSYRGWAQAFARRMKISVVNYDSNYA